MQNLNRKLKSFNKDVKTRINTLKIKTAQLVIFELIMNTPVDTSTALSNWIVNISKPNSRKIKAHSFGTKGSTYSYSSNTAYLIGFTIIRQVRVGEVIYITNNIDYIQLLNEGYSNQAEVGYIENSVKKALEMAKKVKI